MAASYPAGFDTMSDPAANLSGPPLHSTMHNQINDVIEAIEVELGLNPSDTDATVAALLARIPRGEVAYAEATGAQATFGPGITDITGATVTWTAISAHKYEIKATANILQNTAAATCNLTLANSANTVFAQPGITVPGAANYMLFSIVKRVTGLSGSVTFKLRAQTSAGTISMNQSANSPTVLSVVDLGT